MPVHLGSRTKVHLVSANLRKTTTNEPSNKKAPAVTKHIENVEQTLQIGHILKENHISLGDDDTPLHLLGDEDYMPFMMVRAGEDLRQLTTTKEEPFHPDPTRNAIYAKVLRPNPSDVITSPQALGLRVELCKQSFLKTDKPPEDIRIDVLFNGQLTHSTMWPKRLFHEERKSHQLLNVFSGLRNHWMLERAWTIVPPGQDPNGSRRRPVANAETLEDRWNHIQDAVRREAAVRGVSKTGEKPVVAKYLTEVSKLAMPPELKEWSEPRGQTFGIIDVVLTYGHGFKDSPCKVYISEPTRMRSSTFEDREDESISEGISLSQRTDSYDNTGRYNFRRATSDAGGDGRPNTSISRVPARSDGGKKSSQTAHDEEAHAPAGISVEQEGNVVSTSKRLPEYLSQAVTRAGYSLQQPESAVQPRPFSGKGPANFSSRRPQQADSQPARGASPKSNNKRLTAPIVTQLQEIPEEVEDEPAPGSTNHLTSPTVTLSGPLGFAGSSSTLNFGSSQESGGSMPPAVTSSSVFHLPVTGELLPPLEIVPGLRFRRMAEPLESGSPRKKHRLSRSFPGPLDIKAPEGSIGITERGVFTKVGSPRDRSKFKSFTLSSHVDPQQVYVGKPPPISPITPDRNFFQNEDPLIKRVVLKAQGRVFHTFDVAIPFRLSELPVRTAYARDSSQVQRAMNRRAARSHSNDPPAATAAPVLPPIPSPAVPSTPVQQVGSNFPPPPIPLTPIAGRARSQSLDSATSGIYHIPATGGIYHTPNPLPRHPAPPPHHQPQPATPSGHPTTGPTTPASSVAPSSTATGRARRFDDPHHPHAQMERLFRTWQTPELSRDCAVTYAEPPATGYAGQVAGGEWQAGMPRGFGGGVVRQVRSERTGEFEEEGVLVGVRFLVV